MAYTCLIVVNTEETDLSESLLSKLHQVAEAISFVEKRGKNQHQNYNYVQAVDVVSQVRAELLKRKIMVVSRVRDVSHLEYKASRGGTAWLTTVFTVHRFTDVETDESIEVPWAGVGADTGGDKGIYKAFTGGLKYALLSLFLLPTTDDPERDRLTEPEAPERPAAPRIPVDRAQAILASALKVGAAKLDPEAEVGTPPVFHPAFKAKLLLLGVDKIGLLSVDQAEEVEAFLREEAEGES
jgi:hypothetical protein